jgi:hypothetical protein
LKRGDVLLVAQVSQLAQQRGFADAARSINVKNVERQLYGSQRGLKKGSLNLSTRKLTMAG